MAPTLLWMLMLMTADAPPSTPPAAPAATAPCTDGAYRQFDFWLGDWAVFGPRGKQVGRSHIESILGGCAIAETWRSGSGAANDGRSLNRYQASSGQWEQYWVDAQGGRLLLRGGLQGASMVLASEDGVARQRITWTPNADGSVRQLWESSADAGATWTTAFDGTYRRASAG
jgi:hypothetical protein